MGIRDIIKETINDFDWVEQELLKPTIDGIAYRIDTPAPENSRIYNELVNLFIMNGYEPIYGSPKEIPDNWVVEGVAAYTTKNGEKKFVYTDGLDDETYEEHITNYFKREVGHPPYEVVNAEEFLTNYGENN